MCKTGAPTKPQQFSVELNLPGFPHDTIVVQRSFCDECCHCYGDGWHTVKVTVSRDGRVIWSDFVKWNVAGSLPDLLYRTEVKMRRSNGGGYNALCGPGIRDALRAESTR